MTKMTEPDFEKFAFEILQIIDYDLYKEIKAEPYEDDTLEQIKDVLHCVYVIGKSDKE